MTAAADKELARALSAARSRRSALVLYDGVCNVCNWSVQFAAAHTSEPGKVFYASLQSALAQNVLDEFDAHEAAYADRKTPGVPTSSLVITKGKVFSKTEGTAQLLRFLDKPSVPGIGPVLPLLGALVSLVPLFLRDGLYDRFAQYRFRIFGGSDEVQPIPAALEDAFLDTHEGIHACPLPSRRKPSK